MADSNSDTKQSGAIVIDLVEALRARMSDATDRLYEQRESDELLAGSRAALECLHKLRTMADVGGSDDLATYGEAVAGVRIALAERAGVASPFATGFLACLTEYIMACMEGGAPDVPDWRPLPLMSQGELHTFVRERS